MKNSLLIKEMYLMHDWLYKKLEIAESYNEGKDVPQKRFVLLYSEDDLEELYSATPGVMMFKTYEEALEEKKAMEE